MMPRLDLFALGFLLGWTFGVGLMGVLMHRAEDRRRRRQAMGRRYHPSYRSHVES